MTPVAISHPIPSDVDLLEVVAALSSPQVLILSPLDAEQIGRDKNVAPTARRSG